MAEASSDSQLRDLIHQLQHPISDLSSLLALLALPLHSLSLLPPNFRRYNDNLLPSGSIRVSTHVPLIQRALLEQILPTWDSELVEHKSMALIDQYFCPDLFSSASPTAGEVAGLAYSTILCLPLGEHSLRLLTRLHREYPIDRLHSSVFSQKGSLSTLNQKWEDCIQDVVAVPAKVANYCGIRGSDVPASLEHKSYFTQLSIRCECLIYSSSQESTASINSLLTKLVKLGVFPPQSPTSHSQASFFRVTLPTIRSRLADDDTNSYSAAWARIFYGFESFFALQHVTASLFGSLTTPESVLDDSARARALVKREALVLRQLCPLRADEPELWQCASGVLLGREWNESLSRVFVGWVAECDQRKVLDLLLADTAFLWAKLDHVKHSLVSRHRYVTAILLLTICYFPPSSAELTSLVLSPNFVSGISAYISAMDNTVRRCGMLVAEVAAQRAGKQLDFKDWDGDDSGKPWARSFRKLIAQRDMDAELAVLDQITPTRVDVQPASGAPDTQRVDAKRPIIELNTDGYDSDDSVNGYNSAPSSRSSSPTPSELEDIERDPTLNVGRKKIARPVYLAQLGAMLRSMGGVGNDSNAAEDADKIEMALNCAEELIRKKKDYGMELDENAVNLAYGLVSLQDNYDLAGFDEKRQNALNALVACCPRRAAPCIIEEFFKNQYSADQRFVILNALALGARELASLPIPLSKVPAKAIAFPSKQLPETLHRKYISAPPGVLRHIVDGITRQAIDRGRDATEARVPEIVRERRLRIQKPKGVTEVENGTSRSTIPGTSKPSETSFNDVAAEFFIAPMINRFWLFLRDEQTREERSVHHEGPVKYHGAGTGLILNALVLTHFLRSLAVLVHASQHAPEWLGLTAPESLELAITLGTKSVSSVGTENTNQAAKEASVLASALEIALIVLDGCIELDGGRSLSLDHTSLLMGTGEWASAVIQRLADGVTLQDGGGEHGISLRRAASGVLLKVDEITSKWRRSMVDAW